ncbi:DNA-binding protein [Streptomyces sp. ADMS]|uniref:helix-turn-helix transcriptional regulator n=1 Tax=Streptomyces sp. ADMS TaxID=3071415 RepID=UPI00296E276A|nr:DNA-binding protein [Streptomyces sp. ADMS]MDW4904687.1 DNA-binding protein [Streptomyces sp. ADMS]
MAQGTVRPADGLLSPSQVCAEYPLFKTPAALADRRWRGDGPDYIKTSTARSGRVFYRRSAIERWLDERTVTPAAQSA